MLRTAQSKNGRKAKNKKIKKTPTAATKLEKYGTIAFPK